MAEIGGSARPSFGVVSYSKGKLVILTITLLFFSLGKENDLGKEEEHEEAWEAYARS